ncbi:MAG: adenosylcobalamin-dependent ribonucleoside-diphosphate reductase [Chloroflexi bacterium]|nr:adenosylcobalamin-dependent ribonucleoside-diphosphate reductase [Chloroflexota bacterium]
MGLATPTKTDSHEFVKTPLPADLAKRDIGLTENARTVLKKRYLRRGPDGKPVETVEEMFWRVAYNVALAEKELGGDEAQVEKWARKFYDLLTGLQFFPNSPTFTGAGTPLGQLAACFVLKIDDDMGRTGSGIFETLRHAALIQQTGGGNGFSFSHLRPKGSIVKTSNGTATGPIGFLRVYDQAFGEIAQGGCLTPDTLVFTDKGLLRLDEIVRHDEKGWLPHELRVSTDEGPRMSYQGYNNGLAPVLRIKTEEGLNLTGTHNHKLKVMTADGPAWKRFDEIQSGDAILVKLGQHQGQLQSLIHPTRSHGNQVMPQFPTILDEELAFFLGYLVGDGFVAAREQDHRIGVTVAHTNYLMTEMPILMHRLFGDDIHVHLQQKENDVSVTFVIDNRAIKDFMLMNGFGKARSTDVSVPRLIRQSPPEIVGAFLRGLFEADGAISHGYPHLLSTSEKLIQEVSTLLIGLGCPVRIRQMPMSESHYGTNPVWSVRIHSFIGLQNWQTMIGCDELSRFAICYDFEPDLSRETSYVLPQANYWVEPVLEATRKSQIDSRGRGTGKNFRGTSPELRKQLLRYTRGDRQHTLSGYARLSEIYTEFSENARPVNDLWFVTVSEIEDAGEALTLDIEVEENHTYIANGLVSHNSRRGANMAVLKVNHPDIREFITCKSKEGNVANFNISVGITDEFMRAVETGSPFDLINPVDGKVWETVDARELFKMIVEYAHHNGEPGVLFLDAANRENPVPHLYELESTNPCGEQFLGPFENCCLGSVNLSQHVTADGQIDWDKLAESVATSTRFLDDVVTANAYVPAIPQLREAAENVRRIGLGIMGLGDMMYHLGIRYGSVEGQEFASQVMEFVRYHSMQTSIELAKERGPFLAIEGSRYDPHNLKWAAPKPLVEHKTDWNRPATDWKKIEKGLKKYGIRNGAQLTVAPTGTIATVAGCEAYGCEPVFALAYMRYVNENAGNTDAKITLQYTSPLFEQALRKAGLDQATIDKIVAQVNETGSCQNVPDVPENIRRVFVTAGDITAEEHIRMQAALQAHTDNAISKTVNFPAGTTEEEVATAYLLGWKLGCKGLTVYVTGSRDVVVLETAETKKKKESLQAEAPALLPAAPQPLPLFNEDKKPRPTHLVGKTYRMPTPAGTSYITVNENGEGHGQPFEVFIHTSKAGSEIAAVSEAIGRLVSLVLRLASPVSPRNRVKQIVRQLGGIGGGRQLGIGPNKVISLPDAVAQILQQYLDETSAADSLPQVPRKAINQLSLLPENGTAEEIPYVDFMPIGDICPECGTSTLMREEGCLHCYTCGYSEC